MAFGLRLVRHFFLSFLGEEDRHRKYGSQARIAEWDWIGGVGCNATSGHVIALTVWLGCISQHRHTAAREQDMGVMGGMAGPLLLATS
jgi:hypothetical protein